VLDASAMTGQISPTALLSSSQIRPPLTPPYPRRGIPRAPSSDEEGWEVVGLCGLGGLCDFARNRVLMTKTREQSENVYENKQSSSREVEKSRSREVEPGRQAVGCQRFVTLQLSTLDLSTRIRRNKARMSMKTKDRAGAQPPLIPPWPRRGVRWLKAES
jgi:hypothetical protein